MAPAAAAPAAPAPQARADGQTYRSFSADPPAQATIAPVPMTYYAPVRTHVPDSKFPADRKFRGHDN